MKIELKWNDEEKSTEIILLESIQVGEFIVPEFFCSDGCSCPKQLWGYCEALSALYMKIWVLHDYLYYIHLTTRKEADILMRDMLIEAGMRKNQSKLHIYCCSSGSEEVIGNKIIDNSLF